MTTTKYLICHGHNLDLTPGSVKHVCTDLCTDGPDCGCRVYEPVSRPRADEHGNFVAQEGCTRCECGCKYWEHDKCIDCGTHAIKAIRAEQENAR